MNFCCCLATMSAPQYCVTLTDIYVASSSEMEGMGKEAIVAKFIVMYRYLPEATKFFLRDSKRGPTKIIQQLFLFPDPACSVS